MRARLVIGAVALIFAVAARADFSGRVVHVHDGDTISVLVGRQELRVRLAGIDSPERYQPYGTLARRALAEMISGRNVRVTTFGRDRFGRVLGRVHLDNVDVNAEQVRRGWAWVFRRNGDARLLALEAEAKAARRGLWQDTRALPPWEWRERAPLPPRDVIRA
ncbi:MAG TPA: thermonuclease family protein [Casimicrobiaceae bacterium]|nr:thermonuclease family protein [Casimicrobiaceae bacterium]